MVTGLAPGVSRAQAVFRTDTPRAGTLRVTVEPIITTWEREFTPAGRRPIGAALPAQVFVRAERRDTPLILEFGLTDRLAISARLPLVRVRTRAAHPADSAADSASAALDSTLADSTYRFAPIANTRRGLRYFAGDAELSLKTRLGGEPGGTSTSAEVVVRFPTGHLDSPHDLFDVATGDEQTDVEIRLAHELTLGGRLWLNGMIRAARQLPGTRERRVSPQATLLVPRGATAQLDWNPGDYLAVDVAPMLKLGRFAAVGVTVGYWTKRRDHYAYGAAQDSVAVAGALGAPTPAAVLDGGTSERRLRLGAAVSYVGPDTEGGVSVEQTVSAAGGMIPAATVFRIVMRTSRWPF